MAFSKDHGRQYELTAVVDLAYTDLPTGVAVKAVRLPPGAIVTGGGLKVVTVGNGSVSETISVGDSGSGTAYASGTNAQTANLFTALATKLGAKYTAADDITVTRTEGGTAATQGAYRLIVKYVIADRADEVQTG